MIAFLFFTLLLEYSLSGDCYCVTKYVSKDGSCATVSEQYTVEDGLCKKEVVFSSYKSIFYDKEEEKVSVYTSTTCGAGVAVWWTAPTDVCKDLDYFMADARVTKGKCKTSDKCGCGRNLVVIFVIFFVVSILF